jgi:hypothetical protein
MAWNDQSGRFIMKKQKEMVESFQMAHRGFIKNLDVSLDILDHKITEAKEVDTICTGTLCRAIENSINDLSNNLYSISEPRWVSNTESKQLSRMRTRLREMYYKYRGLSAVVIH